MKQKLTLVLALICFGTAAFSQDSRSPKKNAAFGIHLNAIDFTTPLTFDDKNSPRRFAELKDMDFGLSLSWWKGLTNKIDFAARFNTMLHGYAADRGDFANNREVGLELEPTLNIRPVNDNALIAPFLTAGVGGGYYTGEWGAYIPAGVGIQVNFKSTTYLMLQANYRWSLTTDVLKDHLVYSFGVLQSLGQKKVMAPPPPPVPVVLDRDNDGVPDVNDKCPDVPGTPAMQGCPDTDGDGIADADDKCPTQAGTAKYQGCPVPDSDGDGINDELDKCPNVKGLARYQGCPIPDSDGDGVNDEEDKCPDRQGPASNSGCPEIAKEVIEKISIAARNVFYATGSYTLLSKSYKSLNQVADLMKADQTLRLDIDGHTDNVGSDENNQILSEKRANSVKEYLVKRGVSEDRLKATGYGEEKPVEDNATAAGRAKNRRTEMTVRNF